MTAAPNASPPLARRTYVLVALATIAAGFVIHHHGQWMGSARDILGDALWPP